jgi:hypothetical protein
MMSTFEVIEQKNWGATGSQGGHYPGSSFSDIQLLEYSIPISKITKIRIKVPTTSGQATSCKIFILNSSTRQVLALSSYISISGGIAEWVLTNPFEIITPFYVGFAAQNGTGVYLSQIPDSGIVYPTPRTATMNQFNHSNIALGSTFNAWGSYTTPWSFATEVTYLIEPAVPIHYEGILINPGISVLKSHTYNGVNSSVFISHRSPAETQGEIKKTILLGNTPKKEMTGCISNPLAYTTNKYKVNRGEGLSGIKTSLAQGYLQGRSIDTVVPSYRLLQSFDGIKIDSVTTTSDAQKDYTLVITPTHQYRNQLVNIHAIRKSTVHTTGKYQLNFNNTVVVPFGSHEIPISNISIDITPGQLALGNNLCRLTYLYSDGTQEYLDFEIFKEEPKRTSVERLFRHYDGGYVGDRFHPAYNKIPTKHPCFMVPDGKTNTLIKTTDYTNVPLSRYTGLQGISIDASGVRALVSFDKGTTWKSLVSGVWESASLDNISTAGMREATINSIVFARWAELFKPTSIDFAILLDNTVSDYFNISEVDQLFTYSGIPASTYTPPDTHQITSATYGFGTWGGNAFYAYYNGGWQVVGTWAGDRYSGDFYARGIRPTSLMMSASGGGYASGYTVFGCPKRAYLKSIDLQITPSLKIGYAFIM